MTLQTGENVQLSIFELVQAICDGSIHTGSDVSYCYQHQQHAIKNSKQGMLLVKLLVKMVVLLSFF